jgi:hypothetical protein
MRRRDGEEKMNRFAAIVSLACALLPSSVLAQDAKKWKPYQFVGNERYEYKMVMIEGDDRKELGYILDLRKKGDDQFEVTSSTRNLAKKDAGMEILMGGGMMGLTPMMFLMNPLLGAFIEQIELKEGEKMSLFGAGLVKVTKKETVAGRTGFVCEMYSKQDNQDVLTWVVTIDPELALPLRSITYDGGKEKHRAELVSYKKD